MVTTALILRNSPIAWLTLALSAAWFSRLFTATGLAPRALDFIDFPVAIIALILAITTRLSSRVPLTGTEKSLSLLAGLLAVAISISTVATGSPAFRGIAGGLLLLEPFLIIIVILSVRPSRSQRDILLAYVIAIGFIQSVTATVEFMAGARIDDVRGTLLGAGAGAHVMAGGVLLVSILWFARSRSRALGYLGLAFAAAILLMAEAKAVLFIAPLAFAAYLIWRPERTISIRTVTLATATSIGLMFAATALPASQAALSFIEESATGDSGKPAVLRKLTSDFNRSPHSWVTGFGPGQTVSRFAYLTTPVLNKEGSPADFLDLKPGSHTLSYESIALRQGRLAGHSSFLSGQSSLIGVLGDFGLLGAGTMLALITAVLALLARRRTALAAAAAAGWVGLMPLALVFDWLEQPPFMLMLAVITGVALSHNSEDEGRSRDEAYRHLRTS